MYTYDVYDPWENLNLHIRALKGTLEEMNAEDKDKAIRRIKRELFGEDNLTDEEKQLKARLEAALARLK